MSLPSVAGSRSPKPPGRLLLPALLVLALAPAAARAQEALGLVPPEAASVGVVRLDELRSSPLAAKLLADTDRMTGQGDAARFMEEAGLRPKEDVDTVVVAAMPREGSRRNEDALVLFEGRFDPVRLGSAITARGATLHRSPNGDYFLLPDKSERGDPGAVAFASSRLVIAGTENQVTAALANRQRRGGSGFLRGEGLGRHVSRLPGDSSVWVLVDAKRFPIARRHAADERSGDPSQALVGAMKSVSLFAFAAKAQSDGLELMATGLSEDAETRELLEDALRGVLAMWRMAAQEKSPELVTVLRRFEVERDREGVTVTGTLPGSVIRDLTERRHARRQSP
ncbi:MAG: hypothetical protein ABR576_16445 [Thermoanaerobaculia bacterium]